MLLLDDRSANPHLLPEKPQLIIHNKIDLTGHRACLTEEGILYLSAKTGEGVDLLKKYLKEKMGLHSNTEGSFMARRRHLDALRRTKIAITNSLSQMHHSELIAEELRQAQKALGEITGEFTTDDLLGQIFSTFCIGK